MAQELFLKGKPNPFQRGAVPTDISKALIEKENAEKIKVEQEKIAKYAERIVRIHTAIDKILDEEKVNMQEWSNIIKTYNDRMNAYIDKLTLTHINNRIYGNTNERSVPGRKVE